MILAGLAGVAFAAGGLVALAAGTSEPPTSVGAHAAPGPTGRGSPGDPSICDRIAAPSGSDAARGTRAAPFRTAGRLVRALRPGLRGCLRDGLYLEDVKLGRAGRRGARITLRSFPGERAVLRGRLWVAGGHVTVAHLDLDGRNRTRLPSPTVNANDVTFIGNDVMNQHTAICFVLGSEGYGHAARTRILGNRIHDCGRLPPQNHDHGIYVDDASDGTVDGNLIYDNADRGVQLFPSGQRMRITRNVIDGNGEGVIFSGDGSRASSGNLVERNVISNARVRFNVESYYEAGDPVGRGNIVRRNCLWGGPRDEGDGGIQRPQVGFRATGNVRARPVFRDRAAGDLRLKPGSRCAALVGRVAALS